MAAFVPEALVTQAQEATGLVDFGADGWQEGLGVFCAALDAEAQLNDLGVAALGAQVTGALANRLKIVDWAKTHPEVTEVPVEAPLIVIGMFRGGTTFLSKLLDEDHRFRSLLRWESADPVPPATPENWRQGPRVDACAAAGEMMEQLNPGFKKIHHEPADGPTECVTLLAQDFKSILWSTVTNTPGYTRWLFETDETTAYDYHHLALQVLQSGGVGGPWTLKTPHHAFFLRELTARYPDSALVCTHRDPTVLAASVCSLVTSLAGTFTDGDHREQIARTWTWVLEECVGRMDAFRAARPDVEIVDVHYADLVRDPVATMTDIYARTGIEMTDTARAAFAAYAEAHPRGEFGAHRYDFASLGLDEGELRERFAGYVERYAIPVEHVA
ncbi:MAG: sulfotransferase [Acidimicrobiia bacterium]